MKPIWIRILNLLELGIFRGIIKILFSRALKGEGEKKREDRKKLKRGNLKEESHFVQILFSAFNKKLYMCLLYGHL